MGKKKVTIYDVASQAGVSASSVTLALNGKPGISSKTRSLIIDAANKVGYAKKEDRPLVSTFGNIHYVISKMHFRDSDKYIPHFHNLLMQAIQQCCYDNKMFMILHYFGDEPQEHKHIIDIINTENDPMVLLQGSNIDNPVLELWMSSIKRLVVLNNYYDNIDVNTVSFDSQSCVYELIDYLQKKGYENIGRLRSYPIAHTIQERERYFVEYANEKNYPVICDLVVDPTLDESSACILKYIEQGGALPRVLVTDSDKQALGAMHALLNLGFRVPDDIAIVGNNDLPLAASAPVPITTNRLDWAQLARIGVWVLMNHTFGGYNPCLKIRLTEKLIIRDSA
ncbi:MAG: LacI family transcriptional regulator [Oscillospiraceae bacterium]|nr:LacI family transcriptional regulator [Oscillospiraceae bacterium]